ncbi:phage integrase family protein [Acidovorax sp. 100]|uniref:tyrosine-type recombinase/integrase n=1 Tax=Acidovorax sp. 100 TaxID=2135635 RepID=UPI000EF9BF29|nr:site-specific integrase [Acidovorax sp. 100]RMA59977.1 phage integrase family protein [Acidovorax sp. 100]
MSNSERSLPAVTTRVLIDPNGLGSARGGVRRVYLFRRSSGLLMELPVAYLDHEFSTKSRNTQLSVAADIAFFCDWCRMREKAARSWISPERRAAQGVQALSPQEIIDLSRWCQGTASAISVAADAASRGVAQMQIGRAVSAALRNRRLRNICRYVQWLTTTLANPAGTPEIEASAQAEGNRAFLQREFSKRISANSKQPGPIALAPEAAQELRNALRSSSHFGNGVHGARDRLIVELLLQGLRAGELLKLKVEDLNDRFRLRGDHEICMVSVVRRPNDPEDARIYEPSVKTRPGDVPIPARLGAALVDYILGPRRDAVDRVSRSVETPYLFVCHSGRNVGRPITQRNLNRIGAKLKHLPGLPSDVSPHLLRHTHMTEVHDSSVQKGRTAQQIRDVLLQRGRWSDSSSMPAHYTLRSLMEETAKLIEERDAFLGQRHS